MDFAFVKRAADVLRQDYPNIQGVEMGYKMRGGVLTSEVVLRVMVDRKVSHPVLPLPLAFEGVPIDVIEYEPKEHCPKKEPVLEDPHFYRSTIRPGMSVGDAKSYGTVGWACTSSEYGPGFITNDHVVTDATMHVPYNSQGKAIPPPYVSYFGYYGDMAFIPTKRSLSNRPLSSGIELLGVGEPQIGMEVMKSGATTGLTHGVITGLGYTMLKGITVEVMTVQPLVGGAVWSSAGDSGSAIFTKNGKVVGLHFAGNMEGRPEFGAACLATNVMKTLNLTWPEKVLTMAEKATVKAVGMLASTVKSPYAKRRLEREWHRNVG